jgi:hypothetical protein
MCVMATFCAARRRQGEHAFDPKRHLRGRFGDHNLAVCSRVPRERDGSYVIQVKKISCHRLCRLVRRASGARRSQAALEVVADTAPQIDLGAPAGQLLKQS